MNAIRRIAIVLVALFALVGNALAVSPNVVISQVYGGGGNAGATLKNDFIELFNRGASPVSLNGWSVQYTSSAGTSWQVTNLTNVSLAPGQYYLIQEAAGAGGTTSLPTPDATGTINMSATAGKVALVNTTTNVGAVSCPTGASIVDFVGFGTSANCFEGTGPTPAPTNTTSVLRAGNGCTDTDQNASDFTAGTPNPRNTATAAAPCGAPVALSGAGAANPAFVVSGDPITLTVTVTPATTPPGPSTGITVTGDLSSIGGSATQTFFDNGTNGDVTAGDNIFTFATTATGSAGSKSLPISIADAQARTATTTISPTIITLTAIHDIQGNGDTSPLAGQSVSTRGVVTGVRSNGYFIEMPDAQWDADPNTSEGMFVFTSSTPPAAATVGNMVTVTGTVSEFIPSSDPYSPSQTELTSPTTTLFSTGNAMPTAITITTTDTNPNGSIRQLEKYAAMRVHVNTLNVVGPTGGTINEANATSVSNGAFYGVLPTIARPFREPGIQAPDPIPNPPCCIPRFDLNPERIRVDSDAVGGAPIDVTAGATVSNITGPLDYVFRAYTIDVEPATVPSVSGNVTFAAVPARTSTEFTVGCQNLERFFDDVNDSNGAVTLTTTAYNNRLNKASLLIRNVLLAPDILGVEEAETFNGLTKLANKINADAVAASQPNPNYVPYLLNGNDVGGINVGLLINATRITVNSVAQAPGSLTATYTDPTTGSPALIWDRPPLVLDATVVGPPAVPIIVIVNHLRSLSGVDDPTVNGLSTEGDRVRQKRRAGAEWLANYIQGRLTANPNERLVLVGDFNAFEFNDGYVDVMGTIKGTPTPATNVVLASSDLVNPDLVNLIDSDPAAQRYSYNFDGDAQVLDHTLLSPGAVSNFSRFAHGRVDADFPEAYRNDSTRPERLSDHDGEVTYFSLTPTLHYDVSIPANVVAGSAFDGTITVRDALGNVVTNYSGTVHFTSSDGTATLPADYTFNGGDAGVHTFGSGFVLNSPGSQSITATDTVSASVSGNSSTTVACQTLSVGAGNNGPICQGGTLSLNATVVSGATYSWTGPNGFTAAVNNPSIANATPAATGEYDLTINLDGCTYTAATTATVDGAVATPSISADTNGTGTQDQACPEVPLTLHANGATGATAYQWYKDLDPVGTNSSTYDATGAATYYVVASNGSCSAKSAGYVVQDPTAHAPFISFRNQDSSVTTLHICQGSSQIVDSDSATGIHWWVDGVDQGPGNQSYTFNSTTPSTHTFTAQLDDLGCHSQFGRTVTIIVDALPPTPTISGDTNGTGTQDQACPEQPLTLHANGATGATSYTWYSDNAVIPNETTSTLVMTGVGNISVTATNGSCTTAHSATYVVQNPTPHSAFITATGTMICAGGSVQLTSDSATGIQWYKDGVAIPGAGAQQYVATAAGTYTAILDALGCHSSVSNSIVLTGSASTAPDATITAPATVLVSSTHNAASVPDAGAGATYSWAAFAGSITSGNGTRSVTFGFNTSTGTHGLTVAITLPGGCTTFGSTNVNNVASMTATHFSVSAPSTVMTGTPFSAVVTALDDTNSPVTNYSGTVHFTSSSAGTLPSDYTFAGATDNGSKSFNVTLTTPGAQSLGVGDGTSSGSTGLTVVCINPNATITAPASVRTGSTGNTASVANAGAGATYNWSITNGTITAGTGTNSISFTAGAIGTLTLQVTVTNAYSCSDTKSANVNVKQFFDPNGDHTIDPSDIFYLISYLFLHGPAPVGGLQAGDANGDGIVDPADIFYVVNYLYLGGPQPYAEPVVHTESATTPMKGSVSLGTPVLRGDRYVVPVTVEGAASAMSLRLRFDGAGEGVTIHHASGLEPAFEVNPHAGTYLVAYDGTMRGVVAEIEVPASTDISRIEIDPDVTLLVNRDGIRKATVAGGTLTVGAGVSIGSDRSRIEKPRSE